MGGMIAQEMALNHPQKVEGLILVATDCGISLRIKAKPEAYELFSEMIRRGTNEAKVAAADCLFAKQTFENKPEVIQRYTEVSQRFPASQKMLAKQWAAVTQHDACGRLQHISSPTLAVTGAEDVLIPPQNAALLAKNIPDAQMVSIDGGGHLFLIEQPRQFNQAVIEFLERLTI
jgi:pimeloyl-ACP methyl ester carboxylesterase